MDDLTLTTLRADRDHLLRELEAYAHGTRTIRPSDTEIASLRSRLALIDRLIARHDRTAPSA